VKVSLGGGRVEARCSPDEYRVARGDAVDGRGFLRTGDDNGEVDTVVRARGRIDNDGIPARISRGWASVW